MSSAERAAVSDFYASSAALHVYLQKVMRSSSSSSSISSLSCLCWCFLFFGGMTAISCGIVPFLEILTIIAVLHCLGSDCASFKNEWMQGLQVLPKKVLLREVFIMAWSFWIISRRKPEFDLGVIVISVFWVLTYLPGNWSISDVGWSLCIKTRLKRVLSIWLWEFT